MSIFNKFRKLNKSELLEIQELHRLASTEKFKAEQIAGNTVLIPNGQKLAEQTKAVAGLLENAKKNHISRKLQELGYPPEQKISLDLMTGKITIQK